MNEPNEKYPLDVWEFLRHIGITYIFRSDSGFRLMMSSVGSIKPEELRDKILDICNRKDELGTTPQEWNLQEYDLDAYQAKLIEKLKLVGERKTDVPKDLDAGFASEAKYTPTANQAAEIFFDRYTSLDGVVSTMDGLEGSMQRRNVPEAEIARELVEYFEAFCQVHEKGPDDFMLRSSEDRQKVWDMILGIFRYLEDHVERVKTGTYRIKGSPSAKVGNYPPSSETETHNHPEPIQWNGTKSEFCRYVKESYQKDLSNYKSLRKATERIFASYRFNEEWTWENCYELVKKS